MNKNIIWMFVCSFFLLTSCKTKEKTSELNYMQNADQIATEASLKSAVSTIQKGDQLLIIVTAKNMEVVKPFNQNYYNTQGVTSPSSQNVEKPYIVDSEGEIDFPVLGKLSTTGKTLEEFKGELNGRISQYVKNPTVTVRLANFKVTVLGEVVRPGQYTIPEGQTTLLNVLGLAGDLTMYGKRDDVLVVRNVNGEVTKARINILDANFFSSPYFNLKQNDVIYVSATEVKEKTARLDPNTGTYIAIASMVLGLAGIFITIFKK